MKVSTKARGEALYVADRMPAGALYAVYVTAAVASGRVESVELAAGPDQATLVSCLDAPRLTPAPAGAQALLLQDRIIFYAGQPIAAVMAETRAAAHAAAERVIVRYSELAPPIVSADQAAQAEQAPDILRCHEVELLAAGGPIPPRDRYPTAASPGTAFRPADDVLFQPADSQRGDFASGWSASTHRVSATYTTSINNHVPLELHAVIAEWQGSRLMVTTATQAVQGARDALARAFGIPASDVTVHTPFVGGGFGSKARAWFPSLVAAAMLAREAGRPVFLELTRKQTFTAAGCRQPTVQSVDIGSNAQGQLLAIRHRATGACSVYGTYSDPHAFLSRSLYACPNVVVSHRLVHLNIVEPISMRAPGEATGSFALESALDELAISAGIDPVELRLRNLARDSDPQTRLPWSSNHLEWCLREAARAFGWKGANRSVDGDTARGCGMAVATYPGHQLPASCRATLRRDGRFEVAAAVHEIGNGLHTAFRQIAADALGVETDAVVVRWGNSDLPAAPPTVGSMTTASVGPAVLEACRRLREAIFQRAVTDRASALYGVDPRALRFDQGTLTNGEIRESLAVVASRWTDGLSIEVQWTPDADARVLTQSFGAQFVEVAVDCGTGVVRLERIVSAFDIGRAVNPMLARSQLLGGIVFGLGMALEEETVIDPRLGRIVGGSLGEYHIPVQADVPPIEILICGEPDCRSTPFGAKTVGMMGVVGLAAAIGNAIAAATGTRIRSLPFTPDRVIAAFPQ